LYWPKTEPPSVFPLGKGTWGPPGIVPVNNLNALDVTRPGDKSLENIIRTDERYGHDGLFQGPRGWAYWNHLEYPKPIQNPNLWPDTQSTYFLGRLAMPAGSGLNLHFTYPHARYFNFALYKWEHNTFVATEALSGQNIDPDPGSTNPFLVGANRMAEPRSFALRVLADDPPSDPKSRPRNTLYVGKSGGEIQGVIRLYVSDQGSDGAGWGPASNSFGGGGFPTYDGTLADGTKLTQAQVVETFARPIIGPTKQPVSAEQWVGIVNAKDNDPTVSPATAPARKDPKWEKFWTLKYSLLGAFKTPQEQAKIPYEGAMEGGGDPSTQYLVTYLSRKFGTVYVMRGKMPTYPNTYVGAGGKGLEIMPDAQTQYWSLVSCEAPPSGRIVDGISDMQVPLDANGNYTIVVSRPEDRPKNATLENGVTWVEWSPRGEGIDSPQNRTDFGMLMLRIMANNPSWKKSPDYVMKPGMEEAVMGPYLPRGEYTDKATFEASGLKK
jgi:hypothetical protein